MTASTTTAPCPDCGAGLPSDPRFVVWCPSCHWSLAPNVAPRPRRSRLERARLRAAEVLGEQLFAETSGRTATAEELRPGPDLARLTALALALPVRVAPAALGVAAVAVVVASHHVVPLVIAVLLLLLAWFVRPRPYRLDDEDEVLTRASAPSLFGLLDRLTSIVGGRCIDLVLVDPDWNAARAVVGRRRRELVVLGAPLWVAQTPPERLFVLGHEIAHGANGDLHAHGLVRGALQTLGSLAEVLQPPHRTADDRWHADWSEQLFWRMAGWPLWALTQAYGLLLERLLVRSSQRAEYYADLLGAQVAGAPASVLGLASLDLDTTTENAIDAAVRRGVRTSLWQLGAEHLAQLPEHERARVLLLADRQEHSVDATHPPTRLRRRLLENLDLTGAIDPADVDWAAVDAELAPAMARLEKARIERVLYVS